MPYTQLTPLVCPNRHPIPNFLPAPSRPAKSETSQLGSLQDHFAAGLLEETWVDTMEDIDASLETVREVIHDALRVAALKHRPHEDKPRPIPLFILMKILCEELAEENVAGHKGPCCQAQD